VQNSTRNIYKVQLYRNDMAKGNKPRKLKKQDKNNMSIKNNLSIKPVFIISGIIIIAAIAVVLVVLLNKPTTGNVIESPSEQSSQPVHEERIVATEPIKILGFINKKDAYPGWIYSNTETYTPAAKGVKDGARLSLCTGVDKCEVRWWGTPSNAAKLMATASRFIDIPNAENYFIQLSSDKQGTQVKTDCYVFNDNTAICRHHNIVFTIVSEYGSAYYGDIQPVLQDFVIKLYNEVDYWQ